LLPSSRWSKKYKLQDLGLLGSNDVLLDQEFQMFRWNTVPSSLSLRKKALCSFKTSGNLNPVTQHNVLEDLNINNNNVKTTAHLAKINNFV